MSVPTAPEPIMRDIDEGLQIPRLRPADPHPLEYDRATAYTAGYLTSTNAGWRLVRPVIDAEKCTGCLQCYLYCPDGTIRKTHAPKDAPEPAVFVDLDWCKGCGICAKICSFGAIAMTPEGGK